MPTPVYIICSESGSEDRVSGLASVFNVIEQIEVRPLPPPTPDQPAVVPFFPFRVSAQWMKAEDDAETDPYECQIRLHYPGAEREPEPVAQTRLHFTRPFNRVTMRANLPLAFPALGLLRVECRIRREGDTDWLSQEYPI